MHPEKTAICWYKSIIALQFIGVCVCVWCVVCVCVCGLVGAVVGWWVVVVVVGGGGGGGCWVMGGGGLLVDGSGVGWGVGLRIIV